MEAKKESPVILNQWLNGIKINDIAHRRAAAYYKNLGRVLGIPVTVFTIVTGTIIFSTLGSSENDQILLVVGFISLIAAIMSGLQTFLNYEELSVRHQASGIKYGYLRRHVDEILCFSHDPEQLQKIMQEIREEWNRIEEESPTIPQRFHDKALKFVKRDLAEERGLVEETH